MMNDLIRFFIGLDDTDHLEIGCTTEKMNNFLSYLNNNISIQIVERRLVRLWPFASRRTRGNAALSAIIDVKPKDESDFHNLCDIWFKDLLFEISSHPKSELSASPVLITSREPLPEKLYWQTVMEYVDINARLQDIRDYDCNIYSGDDCWGLIGASAAISWTPDNSSSWELIAWRKSSMIGKRRILDIQTVVDLDRIFPDTFLNRDPTKNRDLIAPRTPCPVLYGIRALSSTTLDSAHNWIQSTGDAEICSDYAIHRTNQLSDDHVTPTHGTITSESFTSKGAHSSISVYTQDKSCTLVAFSEGGQVNKLLRSLKPGDMVSWTGLFSPEDSCIHLEKLSLFNPVPRISHRPLCCSVSMKSAGNNQELRCNKCGNKSSKYWIGKLFQFSNFEMIDKWVEPSPSNRRHLAKPLDIQTPILNNLIS